MPDLFGKLKGGAEKVAFEAEKMARLNKAQGEANQVKRQMESLYTQLGEMVYQQYAHPAPEPPSYDDLCGNIASLEQKLLEKQAAVQQINAETFNPQGAAAPAPQPMPAPAAAAPIPAAPEPAAAPVHGKRFCPNCGQEAVGDIKFCTNCGTKLP
jgi:hypothetical protein